MSGFSDEITKLSKGPETILDVLMELCEDDMDDLESLLRANSNLVASEDVLITRHKDINEGIITDIRRRIERIKNNLV